MPEIYQIKESEVTDTPLVLFECRLFDGSVERWSTHQVTWGGFAYSPRVVRYGSFDLVTPGEDDSGASGRLSLVVSNVDSHISQIESSVGLKGSRITATFVFFDLATGAPTSPGVVLFRGDGSSVNELTESQARLTFQSRLSFRRNFLPTVPVQRRCPWLFPSDSTQRAEAVSGGARGRYSPFHACGYSPDMAGGTGNLDGSAPYTTCGYTRADCIARGMFVSDIQSRPTSRFGGMELLPSPTSSTQLHVLAQPEPAEVIPLVYGTSWVQPRIVFARNDQDTTHVGAAICLGPIEGVLKVVVNRIELPLLDGGRDQSATGAYRLVTSGERNGSASTRYVDSLGDAIDGPHGSIAYLELTLPRTVNTPGQTPRIDVLVQGLKVPRYDLTGNELGDFFTANPVWVLLDILRRTGWRADEIDLASFASKALYCDETIAVKDLAGNDVFVPRFQCNLSLQKRRSVSELLRGLRLSCGLFVVYGADGKLQANVEGTLAVQQSGKPWGSNSASTLGGGWPAYEFGDGTDGLSGIVRLSNGSPSIRLWARTSADVANRLRLDFEDEFNLYQRDSFTLADADDLSRGGGEVSAQVPAVGVTNFAHAQRALRIQLRRSVRGNSYVEFETSVRGVGIRPGDIVTVTYLKEGLQRKPFRVMRVSADLNMRTIHIVAQLHDDAWYVPTEHSIGGPDSQPGYGSGIPLPLVGEVLGEDGATEFSVNEGTSHLTDGTGIVTVVVGYQTPRRPSPSAPRLPWVSLSPEIHPTGGTLVGNRTLYYALTSVDSIGTEGPLSFVVRADLPSSSTVRVQLNGISLPGGATAFNVYRGSTPGQLLRIASMQTVATTFIDGGMNYASSGPPDQYFDHANFYWRMELHPPANVTSLSSGAIVSAGMNWTDNQFQGQRVRIASGRGKGQERTISSNTHDSLTVTGDWTVAPDNTSQFLIAEGNWHFASQTSASPAEFEIPNRRDAVVHVTGRSANSADVESAEGLAPITRWTIGGTGGSGGDLGVPTAPMFGLSWKGKGTVELVGVSFESMANTQSVDSGTAILHFYDELLGPPQMALAAAVTASDTVVALTLPGSAQVGQYVQIEGEIMLVNAVGSGGSQYEVSRAQHGTAATGHATGNKVYHLSRKVFVMSFPRGFFGSPASGAFSYAVYLPMVRLAFVEMYVTNQNGTSSTRSMKLTGTQEYGLRTLSGGQFTIQVEGHLAIQDSIAPPLIVEDARVVRDVSAVIHQAPVGAAVELCIRKNNASYALLMIPAGSTVSNVVSGLDLTPLEAGSMLTLDIVSVGQAAGTTPGRDLTVTIRL